MQCILPNLLTHRHPRDGIHQLGQLHRHAGQNHGLLGRLPGRLILPRRLDGLSGEVPNEPFCTGQGPFEIGTQVECFIAKVDLFAGLNVAHQPDVQQKSQATEQSRDQQHHQQ